ncbi:MAG: hypothetical protein ABL933_16490 [Methyloglobulus sp.]|uniref:hypothetical protein n=1 Tax=Methyloglobulus sp. TaxID=2518622 RepID=UPI0018153F9F|nr:hypothetical protein [Methyloglobulus sp.]
MKVSKFSLGLLLAAFLFSSFNAVAAVPAAISALDKVLAPATTELKTKLDGATSDAGYKTLLAAANAIAAKITGGRLVITLQDGTVVLDTKGTKNTYANFSKKLVAENHNTRIAILNAQLQASGIGYETKYSTTDKTTENYLARRLGNFLNSSGTARLSVKQ